MRTAHLNIRIETVGINRIPTAVVVEAAIHSSNAANLTCKLSDVWFTVLSRSADTFDAAQDKILSGIMSDERYLAFRHWLDRGKDMHDARYAIRNAGLGALKVK